MNAAGGRAPTPEIWVVSDGRAGNEKPAAALAAAVAARLAPNRSVAVALKRLALSSWAERLPPAALHAALRARGAVGAGRAVGFGLRDPSVLAAGPPLLAIGAGRRAAAHVAALRRSGAGAAVQILSPQMALGAFDLVIAPRHDGLTGPGVLETVGSLASPPAAASDARLAALRRPLAALLIGGASRAAAFEEADADRLVAVARALSAAGAGVAATASRRTPEASRAMLRAEITALGGFYWDGAAAADGANPYAAFLAEADLLVATADSVNMASEAAALGKPLFIAPVTRLAPKLERFHAALAGSGRARAIPPDLAGAWGADLTALTAWRPEPLDDLTRAADRAAALIAA